MTRIKIIMTNLDFLTARRPAKNQSASEHKDLGPVLKFSALAQTDGRPTKSDV